MPNGEVVWRGRTYDLANVDDLADLTVDLELDNAGFEDELVDERMQRAVRALDDETAAANAKAERLKAQIVKDDARAAALTEELHRKGISTSTPGEVEALVAQWRREFGDRPGPAARPMSDRDRAIHEHRKRAGF